MNLGALWAHFDNRKWLKDNGIRHSRKALGRPKKALQIPYHKRKYKMEQGESNHIEGKSGQGENAYNLNKIRARKASTSGSWIACNFFAMNLVRFIKELSSPPFHAFIVAIAAAVAGYYPGQAARVPLLS